MKNLGFILTLIFVCLVAFHFLFIKPDKLETYDMYEEIMQRNYIRVCVNTGVRPLCYINKDGKYDGYNVELAQNIARYLLGNKNAVVFVDVTPANRLIKLTTGEVDIIIATMTITPERQQIINFSMPYDSAGQALLVKSTSQVYSLSDLAGQNVGVIWGTTAEKNMVKLVPYANTIGFKNYQEAYQALKTGQICAITSDDTILSGIAYEHPDVKLLPKRYTKEPYGIGFRKGQGSEKLRRNLDFALNDMKQKNILNNLHRKWFEKKD